MGVCVRWSGGSLCQVVGGWRKSVSGGWWESVVRRLVGIGVRLLVGVCVGWSGESLCRVVGGSLCRVIGGNLCRVPGGTYRGLSHSGCYRPPCLVRPSPAPGGLHTVGHRRSVLESTPLSQDLHGRPHLSVTQPAGDCRRVPGRVSRAPVPLPLPPLPHLPPSAAAFSPVPVERRGGVGAAVPPAASTSAAAADCGDLRCTYNVRAARTLRGTPAARRSACTCSPARGGAAWTGGGGA